MEHFTVYFRLMGVAMSGLPKSRGSINVVLNRLVREGVITGFKTNFGDKDGADHPRVTVTAATPSEEALDHVRVVVSDALPSERFDRTCRS